MVAFGLFHGLVFLPLVLTLVGRPGQQEEKEEEPGARGYRSLRQEEEEEEEEEEAADPDSRRSRVENQYKFC